MTLLTPLVEIMEEIEEYSFFFPGIICLQYDNSRPDRVRVLHVDVATSGMKRVWRNFAECCLFRAGTEMIIPSHSIFHILYSI